ncbi:hypothetical protein RclHR1_05620002 [Rhizophagus clarus]|uniref:Uncharacterized protein n=1 Tax=Rhizophagus clarus TaxID=94130 RepID=A0A2Z6RMY5_9GLOM|nr:hypothetical protein RclHR1_05620002 [Rhizophagus clarus]
MDALHQSNDAKSTQSTPSLSIIVEQQESWTKALTSSSITSPNFTLASHTDNTIEPKKSGFIIPPTRQALKNDKDLTGSTKRFKTNDGFTGSNNLIITGY